MEPAVSESGEQGRVSARGASHRDAPIGLGLREVQSASAVGEHRREGLTGVEPAFVGLADVGDEFGLDPVRLRDEPVQSIDQLFVGNGVKRESVFGCHASNIGTPSRASPKDACGV